MAVEAQQAMLLASGAVTAPDTSPPDTSPEVGRTMLTADGPERDTAVTPSQECEGVTAAWPDRPVEVSTKTGAGVACPRTGKGAASEPARTRAATPSDPQRARRPFG